MTLHLRGSLLAGVEVGRLVHAYHPASRVTLCGRTMDDHEISDIKTESDAVLVACPLCAKRLAE